MSERRITIRRSSDWKAVQSLDEELIGDVLSAAELADSEWWLARVDGNVVGYCGARRGLSEDDCVYFIRSGVLPDYRGLGLGLKMLRARISWAKRRGVNAIVTETLHNNIPSMRNLVSVGFKPFMPKNPWVGTNNIVYWRMQLK